MRATAGRGGRGRALAAGLALLTASLVVSGLLVEVGVRWLAPQDLSFFDSERFFDTDDAGFPRFAPHRSGTYAGVPVSIDGQRLRDREVAVPKPAGLFRVLAIGDSVTFGFGVRLEDTWVKQLEAQLRARYPGRAVDVLNAGMGATALDYYRHVLVTRAGDLEPDLVLVGIVLNDILDYDARQGGGWNAYPHLGLLHHALATHSQFYMLNYMRTKSLLYRTGWLDINRSHAESLLAVAPPSEYQRRAWPSTLAMLETLITEARRRRLPLVLVVFPMEMQLDARAVTLYREQLGFRLAADVLDATPQRRLAAFAREQGVPLIDLLPAFRASPSGLYYRNPWVSLDWVHPSPVGHRVAAEEVFRRLLQLELLPAGGATR